VKGGVDFSVEVVVDGAASLSQAPAELDGAE
jgi:hypothetical protein